MIREFVLLLAKHGDILSGYFRYVPQGQYNNYDTLFREVVNQILNAETRSWNSAEITYLSSGGTKEDRILILPPVKKELTICDYLITHAYYSPLFGVEAEEQDALDMICLGRPDLPASLDQAKKYMRHVWELVLNLRPLG